MNDEITKAHVSFGVRGDELSPSKITEMVGHEPTKAWSKGDEYPSKYRKSNGTIGNRLNKRPWGIWELSSESLISSESIKEHATFLLNKLVPNRKNIQELLQDNSLRVSISIWWEPEGGQGGYTLPANIMEELSQLCNEIDFYFC